MNDADATILHAGMAAADITPPTGLPLAGFPSTRENIGVGPLPLYARALAVGQTDAAPQAAVLVLDTIGVGADVVARVRQAVAAAVDGLPAEAVMVCATHTHSAPALRKFGPSKPGKAPSCDPAYVEKVVEAAAQAVKDAWQARCAVTLSCGCGEEPTLHHNRRVVGPDGKAHNEWLDPDHTHDGMTNPDVPFLVFREVQGGRVAWVLGSYACHPVTLGPPSLKSSPDYPGGFVKAALELTGARDVMFITGAGANANPREALGDDHDVPQRVGRRLAEVVVAGLDQARVLEAAPIASFIQPLTLELGPEARENYSNRAAEDGDPKHITTEVQAIRVGQLVFISAPGELFAEIGQAMERNSPAEFTIVASFTNDYLGYLFTDKAREEGGYEANNAISLNIEQPLVAAAKAACGKLFG